MYQFPADAEFGIWIEDHDGGGGEVFPEDFQLGLSELMEYTFDASAIPDVDLSNVAEIWIMSSTAAGGTFYLDDLVIGDGSLIPNKVSGSGNGFADNFDYDDATVYEDVAYEGIEAEWPEEAVIEDGMLKWDLAAAGEGAIGLWELQMDLTGNTDITFMYQFPADAEFGIWIEDHDGGGGEVFPEDFQLGLSELMEKSG